MAYGFAASRLVSFTAKYDHPDRWFDGYKALAHESDTPLSGILCDSANEDRDRDALLMDIELEAELLMLYFQDVLGRIEEGIATVTDKSDTVAVADLDLNTLIELGSPEG